MSNQCNPKRLERLIPQIADLVIKNLRVSGETDVTGNLEVSGETDVTGNLDVSGNIAGGQTSMRVVGSAQHQLQDVKFMVGTGGGYGPPSQQTLTAADSGKTIFLSGYIELILPTPLVSGLHFKIITQTEWLTNKLIVNGGFPLLRIKGNTQFGPYWAYGYQSIRWNNSYYHVMPGDMWEVYCDGNYWYVYGTSVCGVAYS